MIYILTFEKFNIQKEQPDAPVRTDMTLFNNSEDNVKDYDKRKNQLSQIYMNYKDDDNPVQGQMSSDLYNKLLSGKFIKPGNKNNIEFSNPLFAQYAEFCTKQRQTKNIQNNLANKEKNIEDTQKNIQNNLGDRQVNNDTVSNLTQDIQTQKKELDTVDKDTKELQNSTKKQLQSNIKDLDSAKKRITKLSDKN
jgi:DNA repair exonuclease SbcCD ATPase subunit